MGTDAGEVDRELFDDVDDYDGLNVVVNSFGDTVLIDGQDLYAGFSLLVNVFYDANYDGIDDGVIGPRKLITITVTTPLNQTFIFSTYRSNF